MKDKVENQLAGTLHALANAFQSESEKEHLETVKKLIADNEHLDITKPEMFGLLTALTLDAQRDLLARIALANSKVDATKLDALSFVYTHYNFMEQHLENIIRRFEGGACSADKIRWLLNSYAAFIISGKLPLIEERHYWHPQMTNVTLWMDWMCAFSSLYYGNEADYVRHKTAIEMHYKAHLSSEIRSLHETFTQHANYVDISQEEKNGKFKAVYHFIDPDTHDKGTVLLDTIAQISYRFFFEGEQRYAKHKDTLPTWFQALVTLK